MASNDGYLNPLLALSGNPLFLEARKKLVQSLSTNELQDLIQEALTGCATRELQEALSIALLDLLVEKRVSVPEAAATADSSTNALYANQTAGRANPEPTATSHHSNNRPTKSSPTSSLRKKARVEPQDIIEINDDEEIELGNIDTHTASNQPQRPKMSSPEVEIIMGRIVVKGTPTRVPTVTIGLSALGSWHPLTSLNLDVVKDLENKFMTDYTSTEICIRKYGAMARDMGKYMKYQCVNTIIHGNIQRRWTLARTACCSCIAAKSLCVKLVEDEEQVKLCICPLPETYRQGKTWNDMAYWVTEDCE